MAVQINGLTKKSSRRKNRAADFDVRCNIIKTEMKRLSYDQYKKYFDLVPLDNGKKNNSQDSGSDKGNNNKNKYKEAFEYAVRTREFEINLYWERAKYFWTFIAAAFAIFGVIQKFTSGDNKIFLSILVSCLGLLFSFAWYCVNRGSKQWQENWENHVALLEDNVTGPLFKIVLTRHESQRKKFRDFFIGPGPFSVSKINQLVSIYITIFWFFLLFYSTPFDIHGSLNWTYIIPICLTFIFCLCIYAFGRSDFNEDNKKIGGADVDNDANNNEFDYIHKAMIFKTKIAP